MSSTGMPRHERGDWRGASGCVARNLEKSGGSARTSGDRVGRADGGAGGGGAGLVASGCLGGFLGAQAGEDGLAVGDQFGVAVGGELGGVAGSRWGAELGGGAAHGGPRVAGEQFVESGDHRVTSTGWRRGEGRRRRRVGTG